MERITERDVNNALQNLKRAMHEAGISRTVTNMGETATLTADDVRIEAGSPTYGRTWRIYYVGPFGAHYDMDWSSYLGWTGREALTTVHALTSGIRAAVRAHA